MHLNDRYGVFYDENKVLFASNGDERDGSLLNRSRKLYDFCAKNYFNVDYSKNGRYGYSAFLDIFKHAVENSYKYIIYIDIDCFIINHENLKNEFEIFMNSGDIIRGPSDGGIFCHRNKNRLSLNPFIMFVNVDGIKDFYANGVFNFGNSLSYDISNVDESVIDSWEMVYDEYSRYRFDNDIHLKHADLISSRFSNDSDTLTMYGINQSPWTYDDRCLTFEPYYMIFLGILENRGNGLSYMYAADFPCEADDSGITSAVFCSKPRHGRHIFDISNLICVHTWFSRLYDIKTKDRFKLMHHDRIDSVLEYSEKSMISNLENDKD